MKIGIISDTHIKPEGENLPKEIFEIFKDVDLILHAGDLVNLTVLNMLSSIAPVEAVYGNMDSTEIRGELPKKKCLEIEGKKIGLTHGDGPPWGLRSRVADEFFGENPDIIVYGHSHAPEAITTKDGILFINPGSPTDKVFTRVNSVAIMEVSDSDVSAEIIYL